MSSQQSLTKQETDRIMQISCNTRGEEISGLAENIKKKYGEEGIRKVEEKLKELGYPTVFSKLQLTGWYPEGLNVLLILLSKEILGWTNEEIFEMGRKIPQLFFITKMFIKYFVSVKKTFDASNQYWRKFMTCGELEPFKFNEKEKYAIWRLKDYKFHPTVCFYLGCYFLGVAEIIIRSEKITMEETACVHRGNPYHEYTLHWV